MIYKFTNIKTFENRFLKLIFSFIVTNMMIIMMISLGLRKPIARPEPYKPEFVIIMCVIASFFIIYRYFIRKIIEIIQLDFDKSIIIVTYSRCFWYKRLNVINFKDLIFKSYKRPSGTKVKVYNEMKFGKLNSQYFELFQEVEDFTDEEYTVLYNKFLEIDIMNHPESENEILKLKSMSQMGKIFGPLKIKNTLD